MSLISLDQPSMAINDPRVTFCKIAMGNTMNVQPSDFIDNILDWVAVVAKNSTGGKLKNLVINCHGAGAYMQLGSGVYLNDAVKFKKLKGLVKTMWFTSCQVAKIGSNKYLDGNVFCSSIAKAAACNVVGGTANQIADGSYTIYPFGKIHQYEGLALVYGPGGNIIATYMGGYFSKPFL